MHAITFLVEVWNGVTQSTLVNCLQKSGLVWGPERNEEVVDPAILARLHMNEEILQTVGNKAIIDGSFWEYHTHFNSDTWQ